MPSHYMSKTEAVAFLTDKLRLQLTDSELASLSLALLQKICTAFVAHLPFSTIFHLSGPTDQLHTRDLPTLEQVKHNGLNLKGGLCYELNVFLHWLLAALGFSVEFLMAKGYSCHVYNHALNYVTIDGARYLVDGASYPLVTETLICLDFQGEVSPVSRHSIWEVRVKRTVMDGEPALLLQFRWTDNVAIPHWKVPVDTDGWVDVNEFILRPRSLEELYAPLKRAYTDATIAPVINRVFCFSFPQGKFLNVRNTSLHTEDDQRRLVMRPSTHSPEELVQLVMTHYGDHFQVEVVEQAVRNFVVLCEGAFSPTFM
ncbi:hypothetical protein BV898_09272 [Hypsibius exemplaris]|uniref:arylamine N-acetyltransferase n=1 Tax=Hypsibius exemplaris TaxID=2072580 RepID=A0A1W0WN43_HYPEX|nr:hypothetical protein BV898_09272 [Hypsibius exemplaris]